MKALVIGGSGFVGQHCVNRLAKDGIAARIYDRVLPRDGSGICADIQDVELLTSYMAGADLVFHLASNADISKSSQTPTLDFLEGTQLTQKVLEAMRLSGAKRLIYFSGSGVYGESAMTAFREDHGPLEPISTYGASKLASEAMISAYCQMFGIQAKVFRPANIVGPRQTHGVGFDFVQRLKKDPRHLRILGNGAQNKSYIHIQDVLDGVWRVMENWDTPYQVFNVASDDSISVELIAMLTADLMGVKSEFEFTGGDRGWTGDVPIIRLDCSRLKAMGWSPTLSSAQAVTLAISTML